MNRGHLWIGYVVLLLVGNIAAVTTLAIVSGDPASRVLPDYYDKAAAYDDLMAQQRASAALGWSATPSLSGATIEIDLRDRAGVALHGATVSAIVDPRGRTDRTATATLREAAPGVYRGVIDDSAPGLYVVATTAERGGDRFIASATIERAAP